MSRPKEMWNTPEYINKSGVEYKDDDRLYSIEELLLIYESKRIYSDGINSYLGRYINNIRMNDESVEDFLGYHYYSLFAKDDFWLTEYKCMYVTYIKLKKSKIYKFNYTLTKEYKCLRKFTQNKDGSYVINYFIIGDERIEKYNNKFKYNNDYRQYIFNEKEFNRLFIVGTLKEHRKNKLNRINKQ